MGCQAGGHMQYLPLAQEAPGHLEVQQQEKPSQQCRGHRAHSRGPEKRQGAPAGNGQSRVHRQQVAHVSCGQQEREDYQRQQHPTQNRQGLPARLEQTSEQTQGGENGHRPPEMTREPAEVERQATTLARPGSPEQPLLVYLQEPAQRHPVGVVPRQGDERRRAGSCGDASRTRGQQTALTHQEEGQKPNPGGSQQKHNGGPLGQQGHACRQAPAKRPAAGAESLRAQQAVERKGDEESGAQFQREDSREARQQWQPGQNADRRPSLPRAAPLPCDEKDQHRRANQEQRVQEERPVDAAPGEEVGDGRQGGDQVRVRGVVSHQRELQQRRVQLRHPVGDVPCHQDVAALIPVRRPADRRQPQRVGKGDGQEDQRNGKPWQVATKSGCRLRGHCSSGLRLRAAAAQGLVQLDVFPGADGQVLHRIAPGSEPPPQ